MKKVASKSSRPALMGSRPRSKPSLDRAFSSIVVDGIERAPSRGMLYATGFKKDDFRRSQIGVASTWSMVTPCNMHIDQLAVSVAQGISEAGGKAIVFNTITISDGISMGTEGMKYSLVSRRSSRIRSRRSWPARVLMVLSRWAVVTRTCQVV
jgi:dihydroxy-acid dehydratase